MDPRTTIRRDTPGLTALATLAALATFVIVAGIATAPRTALAFPEDTETQGTIPGDLNGVWLVVHHLTFNRPTPQATPGAEALPTKRTFNVINLFRITHLGQGEAAKARAAREQRQQASVTKAEAIIAQQKTGKIPVQTAEGEIEGGPRVVVPQVPRPPGYDPKIHEGDKVEIFLLDVQMPKTVDDAFQAAQKAEEPYEPSDRELALLRSSWQSLTPVKDTEYSRIEWKIVAAAHYDQGLQVDPNVQGSTFAISGTQSMVPRPGQPNKNIVVYGIREATDTVMSGGHVRAMMATAPFPIPIELKGDFKMIKVADLPGAKKGTEKEAKAGNDDTATPEEKEAAAVKESDAAHAPAGTTPPAEQKDAEPAQ
jgi:hypothetical protein